MSQDTPENDLKLLRKAVIELFDRGELSLRAFECESFILCGENGAIGKTLGAKTFKQIDRAFMSQGRRVPQ